MTTDSVRDAERAVIEAARALQADVHWNPSAAVNLDFPPGCGNKLRDTLDALDRVLEEEKAKPGETDDFTIPPLKIVGHIGMSESRVREVVEVILQETHHLADIRSRLATLEATRRVETLVHTSDGRLREIAREEMVSLRADVIVLQEQSKAAHKWTRQHHDQLVDLFARFDGAHASGLIDAILKRVQAIEADVLDKWNCHDLAIYRGAGPADYSTERGVVARVAALERLSEQEQPVPMDEGAMASAASHAAVQGVPDAEA